ncbi:hypothetical protein [Calidithermus timidus]|jgi:cyclopropane fatty-acyl-phospholipid synthase-like methyltransferase|uniref:hypothetical protein n=1 Tax=Calidithermus timidus TaxID=307124 RepID=UPI00035E41A1|nr:hypothetical protein [Calidithermus timidus]
MFGFHQVETYRLHSLERLNQLRAQAEVARLLPRQSLRQHLARMLRSWAEALEAPTPRRRALA